VIVVIVVSFDRIMECNAVRSHHAFLVSTTSRFLGENQKPDGNNHESVSVQHSFLLALGSTHRSMLHQGSAMDVGNSATRGDDVGNMVTQCVGIFFK
jgi:hypothetical protein